MKFINKIKSLLRIVVTTKNWPPLLFKSRGVAHFRSGLVLRFSDRKVFMDYVNLFRECPSAQIEGTVLKFLYTYKDKKRLVFFDFGSWKPNMIGEIFLRDEYLNYIKEEMLNNKTVVDVGASFGETAVFFALHGASKVYAIEPVKSMYDLIEKNVKLNNLAGVCIPVFGALGGWSGNFIDDKNSKKIFHENIFTELKNTPIFTLESFVEKNGIQDAILKLDCEGYEKDIVLNTSRDTLRKFEYIVAEYHYGFDEIVKKLEDFGFVVSREPKSLHFDKGRSGEFKNLSTGFIFAERSKK